MRYGVYTKPGLEIVLTPRFVLTFYDSADTFGCRLYDGNVLCAICDRDKNTEKTSYAFLNSEYIAVSNSSALAGQLGSAYPAEVYEGDAELISCGGIVPIPVETPMPTVSQAGIAACLKSWRLGNQLNVFEDTLSFIMNTDKYEYVMTLRQPSEDIYCAASVTIPYENGLQGGMQRFRIRNYADNTAPFCAFHCSLNGSIEVPNLPLPNASGTCVSCGQGLAAVKSHTEDEIILQGCGDDEYGYFRDAYMTERFTL
ncbi:MAG: hypothetical protein AB9835_10050 [Eubacteriales bacterium]